MVINLRNYVLGVFQVLLHIMRCVHGSIEYQHTTPVECCWALFPMQRTQTSSLDSHKCPCICEFVCCSIQQFLSTTPLAKQTRNLEKSHFHHCVASCDLVESLWIFLFWGTEPNSGQQVWYVGIQ